MTKLPILFIDSADQKASESLFETGAFHGLTTNPTILDRANKSVSDLSSIYEWAVAAGAKEVCFQSWGRSSEELLENAQRILEIDSSIVVKVPATKDGFTASSTLISQGAQVLITAVYAVEQMVLAQAIGAKYIAPYFGRMKDSAIEPISEISKMQSVANASSKPTKIVVASLRQISDITELAALQVPSFTISTQLAEQLFSHPKTAQDTEVFEKTIEASL